MRIWIGLALVLLADRSWGADATFTNPVFTGEMPDPTILRHDGFYYAFGTTGTGRIEGKIFKVIRSPDLVNWTQMGGALTPPSPNPKYQYWAPEVVFAEGKFYLYYAMGGIEPEHFENRVAISTNPAGPYIDSGHVLMDCTTNRFTIDPFPFRDDDGQWYFFYACNFPNTDGGAQVGTGIMVDRLIDMTRLAGDCHMVVRPRYDWTLYLPHRQMDIYKTNVDWHTIEGPCVLKHDGKYYCIYSGANYQTIRYGLDSVVADHPLGPYSGQGQSARVLHGIPGKVLGPGHNDVIYAPDGKTQYFVYHAWDKAMKKRQLCIDKLYWSANGPVCVGPTFTPQPYPGTAEAKIIYTLETKTSGFVGFTNLPNTTPVQLQFSDWTARANGRMARFTVTNSDARAILIYDYRVEAWDPGEGTNAAVWKVVQENYPTDVSKVAAGGSGTISIEAPGQIPWRFCILYSRGTQDGDSPDAYDGNYETISPELKSE